MTLEELKAMLDALKTKVDASDAEIASLKAKNAEIITEKRDLQAKHKELKEAFDALGGKPQKKSGEDDPPEPKGTKELRERIEAPLQASLKALSDQLASMQKERDDLAVENALNDALKVAGVAVPYQAAAKALIRSSRKIELANGAVMCDGKDVKDSVTEWAKTDEGKAFVLAPSNGGSAAPGGSSGAISKKRSEMTPSEKGAYVREHGQTAYSQLPA